MAAISKNSLLSLILEHKYWTALGVILSVLFFVLEYTHEEDYKQLQLKLRADFNEQKRLAELKEIKLEPISVRIERRNSEKENLQKMINRLYQEKKNMTMELMKDGKKSTFSIHRYSN